MQLFSAVKVLGYTRRPKGRRVALISNGNGPPQLALDLIGPDAAVLKAELTPATQRALAAMLEPDAAIANPVITYVPLTPERIRAILDAVLDDAGVDGVLVLLAPDALADMPAVARELAQVAPKARKPVVTCFMATPACGRCGACWTMPALRRFARQNPPLTPSACWPRITTTSSCCCRPSRPSPPAMFPTWSRPGTCWRGCAPNAGAS